MKAKKENEKATKKAIKAKKELKELQHHGKEKAELIKTKKAIEKHED